MKMKKTGKRFDLLHIGFEIGLLLKGIVGALEMIGGVSLLFLSPQRLDKMILFVTQLDWSEDRRDMVANLLNSLSERLAISPHHFETFYLLAHGVAKIVLVTLLWRKKRWAYPLTICVFLLLVAYQVYRYSISGGAFLMVISVFDIVMVALTIREYRILERK